MSEDEILSVIGKLAKRFAANFKFGFYDIDDIKQEIYIMGLDAVKRYDGRVPLENFLAVHIKNRLKSLRRDKYSREGYVCTYCSGESDDCQHCLRRILKNNAKKNLVSPIDLDLVSDESESNMRDNLDILTDVTIKEYTDLIDKHLDISYRSDYLRMRSGSYVTKHRRLEIENVIKEILEEYKSENW